MQGKEREHVWGEGTPAINHAHFSEVLNKLIAIIKKTVFKISKLAS